MNNMFKKKVCSVSCWATVSILSIFLAIYGASIIGGRGLFFSEQYFTFGITSKNGVVTIPPTAWLPGEEMSISISSILNSNYLMNSDDDILVTIFIRPDNEVGINALCGVKRFHLGKYNKSDVENLVDSVINDEWGRCEKE